MFILKAPFTVLLSKWIFILLLTFPIPLFADNWQIKVYKDNYIEVSNFWNKEIKELEFQVTSEVYDATYKGKIKYSGNSKKGMHFPYDFSFEGKDSITNFDSTYWRINIFDKKTKLASFSFQYNNNQITFLQITPYKLLPNTLKNLDIWGVPLDSYTWYDKIGEQLVVRSYLRNISDSINFKTYIYLYVFKKNEISDTWILQKKVTDYIQYCDGTPNQLKNLHNIQLSDVNCDSIGEISHGYFTNLNQIDSLRTYRLVVVEQQQKYVAEKYYAKRSSEKKIALSTPQLADDYIKRYIFHMVSNISNSVINK